MRCIYCGAKTNNKNSVCDKCAGGKRSSAPNTHDEDQDQALISDYFKNSAFYKKREESNAMQKEYQARQYVKGRAVLTFSVGVFCMIMVVLCMVLDVVAYVNGTLSLGLTFPCYIASLIPSGISIYAGLNAISFYYAAGIAKAKNKHLKVFALIGLILSIMAVIISIAMIIFVAVQ